MPHLLVTGGAGYIGAILVPKLIARGYRVRVLDLFLYGDESLFAPHERLDLVRADLRDFPTVEKAIRGIDTVIHLAGISNDPSSDLNPALTREVNIEASRKLIDLARDAGVTRFINASSSSVYGIKEARDVTEDLPLEPLTVYSESKVAIERYLDEHRGGMTGVSVRSATVCGYSPRMRLDLTINILTHHAVTKGKISVFGGEQKRPNIHIDDISDFYARLVDAPASLIDGEKFNVCGANHTVGELADQVRATVAPDCEIAVVPTDDRRSYHISADKVRRRLGFEPKRKLTEAMREVAEALRAKRLVDPDSDRYYNVRVMKNTLTALFVAFFIAGSALADTSGAVTATAAHGSPKLTAGGVLVDKARNPAVSATALLGGAFGDAFASADRGLRLQDAEVMFSAAVDSHLYGNLAVRADGGTTFGIEEAYVTSLSLSPVTLKAGKYLVSFGRNNPLRLRGQPLVDRPLANRMLLGTGINAIGAEGSVALPLPWIAELTVGGVRAEGSGVFAPGNPEQLAVTARFNQSFLLTDDMTLEQGASFATTGGTPTRRFWGADLVLKYMAGKSRDDLALTWINEWIQRNETANAWGLYSTPLVRLSQRWWVGGRFDYFKDAAGAVTKAENLLLAFVASESSVLRAQGGLIQNPGGAASTWQALLQFNMTVGPHPAHAY